MVVVDAMEPEPPCSLGASVEVGEDVFRRVAEASLTFPKAGSLYRGPVTWSDAQVYREQGVQCNL